MALHESGEDYLEAILILREERGTVRSVDVAQHLGFSKPSVSRAVSILRADGLLEMDSDALIVRTSAFFGPWDRYNFLVNTIEQLRRGDEVVASDRRSAPRPATTVPVPSSAQH